ncbi:MAG: hypothetical protein LBV44_04880 [Methylobacillus sp.]|jgi:hypothetical protein|nr:hypothetical protein [Methylobacillus sp.]
MMKKVLYVAIGVLVLWLVGVVWATHWIDGKSTFAHAGRYELATARFLWAWSPAIDREKDAERAMKFSWIRASSETWNKKNTEREVLGILQNESGIITAYLMRHSSLSQETKMKAFIQVLTYYNRVNLFQRYFDPALDSALSERSKEISLLSSDTQEDWCREMMIYWRLKGDESRYIESRSMFLKLLYASRNERAGGIPIGYAEGIIGFLDGTLLCVVNKPTEALQHLESAAIKLKDYPEYTAALWEITLNILLLEKGMTTGQDCKKSISKLISSGE